MSNPPLGPLRPADLPAQPNLEHLRKIAKQRLRAMRRIAPSAKLADAQFQIAREHGFASWRSLKAEIDRRRPHGGAADPSRPAAPSWRLPSEEAVRTILADRIDHEGDGVGIVVGVIDAGGPRPVAHGRSRRDGRRKVAGDTIFEIGSVVLGPTGFFYRTIDVELSFETDGDGGAIALVTRSQARGENRAVRE